MKIIGEVKNVSGIYLITNIVNGKVYVGSSNNLRKRMNAHKSHLNNNKHDNLYLQKSWNKHGSENFSFSSLELVSQEFLLEREQYWMDKYESHNGEKGYNLNPTAGSPSGRKQSNEERKQRSLSSPQKKTILQIDVDGKLKRKWNSISEISRELNINRWTLLSRIKNKTNFNDSYFVFEHEFTDDISCKLMSTKDKKKLINNKAFFQFDLEGNLIREWSSISEMNNEFGFSISTISNALKNRSKFNKNYYLIPKHEFTEDLLNAYLSKKQKKHKGKKVNQYNKNGEFIQIWDAIKHASDFLNIDKKSIDFCCKGIYKQAGGFIWSYAN